MDIDFNNPVKYMGGNKKESFFCLHHHEFLLNTMYFTTCNLIKLLKVRWNSPFFLWSPVDIQHAQQASILLTTHNRKYKNQIFNYSIEKNILPKI